MEGGFVSGLRKPRPWGAAEAAAASPSPSSPSFAYPPSSSSLCLRSDASEKVWISSRSMRRGDLTVEACVSHIINVHDSRVYAKVSRIA